VLQALAEMNHKNLVVAPDVSGTLSLHLKNVPWQQAAAVRIARALFATAGDGHMCILRPGKRRQAQREAEQAKQLQNLPLQAERDLHYADAEELAKAAESCSAPGEPDGGQTHQSAADPRRCPASAGAEGLGAGDGSARRPGGAGGAYRVDERNQPA
jgi:type II secretory pathway component HofQ